MDLGRQENDMTILLEDITKAYNGRNVLEHKNISIEWGGCYGLLAKKALEKQHF